MGDGPGAKAGTERRSRRSRGAKFCEMSCPCGSATCADAVFLVANGDTQIDGAVVAEPPMLN